MTTSIEDRARLEVGRLRDELGNAADVTAAWQRFLALERTSDVRSHARRLATKPGPRRAARAVIGVAGATACVVAVLAVISARSDHSRVMTSPSPFPTPEPGQLPSTTSVSTTTPATTSGVPTTTSGGALPTTPIDISCSDTPTGPPNLPNGDPPGAPTVEQPATTSPGATATWGAPGPNAVQQLLGPTAVTTDLLDTARQTGHLLESGPLQAAVTPVGDPPTSVITIDILDTRTDCIRRYLVGPGIELDQAVTFTQSWLDSEVTPTTVDAGVADTQPAIVATIPVEDGVKAIAAASGRVWVGSRTGTEIVAIDQTTNQVVARIARQGTVAMTVDRNPAGTADEPPALYACSTVDTVKIDPARAEIVATYPYGCNRGITIGFGAIWIENWTQLVELGPAGDLIATIPIERGGWGVVAGAGSIWVADGFVGPGTVTRIDPYSHTVVATIPVPVQTRNIIATDTAVWITTLPNAHTNDKTSLIRIDPATNTIAEEYPEGTGGSGLDLSGRYLWAVGRGGAIFIVDTLTNDVVARPDLIPTGPTPGAEGLVAANGSVWITIGQPGTVLRVNPGAFGDTTGTAVGDGPGRTVESVPFQSTGDPTTICSAAIIQADPNHYQWQGLVLKDTTVVGDDKSIRWLFCYGEGASGQGVVALWSENSADWRFSSLAFGRVFHAGDSLNAVVSSDLKAEVTYDSLAGEEHTEASTDDGGKTWTVAEAPADAAPIESSSVEPSTASSSTARVETAAPTTVGDPVQSTSRTVPSLVPPDDPSSLIGATTSTKQVVTNPGSVPQSSLPVSSMLINEEETNLVTYGAACINADCQRSVALLADGETFINQGWPSASYLALQAFHDQDSSGTPIWRIIDVLTISNVPTDTPVSLLADGCTFANFPAGVIAVATLVDWKATPATPSRVWGLDETNGVLVEMEVDPSWTCEQLGN